ncbi:MAG: hypothetical protein GX338_00525 [Firmicutes bacterium]|nr:hypothetical protein [Bacillota bacterium]
MTEFREGQIRDKIHEVFGPCGLLSEALPGYEFRESQQEMAFGVLRSFLTSRHAFMESGTGTGKSIAYLVPAILWSSTTGNKVVISTNTINLQEQLIHKDLPSLVECLGVEFKYCLVKGRPNYVCLRKLAVVSNEMEDETDDAFRLAFAEFISELAHVPTGTRSDFHLETPDEIWDRIASDSMSCLRSRCPWSKRCYFLKARSQMEDSGILVTNHHLLFSDIALRAVMPDNSGSRVLPEYEYLIVDEAHNIPPVAEEHLGYKAGLVNIQSACNELVHVEGSRRGRGGLLFSLRAMIFTATAEARDSLIQNIVSYIDSSIEATRRSYEASTSFFQSFGWFLKHVSAQYKRGSNAVRLKKDITESIEWQDVVIPSAEKAIIRGQELLWNLNQILERLDMLKEDSDIGLKSLEGDIQGVVGRLSSEITALSFVVSMEDKEFVYWSTGYPTDIQLIATPLNVASALREHLFDTVESVVLTSATMTVGGDFQFFKHLVGLDEQLDPPLEFIFDSPFDFPNQALLIVPEDLPDPRDPLFTVEAARLISEIIQATQGRAFVLFTSYAMLDKVEEVIRPSLEGLGIKVFRQGSMPRHRMLTCFREEPGALLGADSFWQGVDVPGDALSCVILARLPFQVPTNPVYEARMEAFKTQAIDGFRFYALPSAVIRFRQGFGRLIRSSEDRGVVVVLDNRLVRKWYGRAFLSSLPSVTLAVESSNQAVDSIRKWLGNQ